MAGPQEIIARHFQTQRPVRIEWRDGIITSVQPAQQNPGVWVAPTLLDVQVNGYAGVDFQQDGIVESDLLQACQQLRQDCCAEFCLTLVTDDWDRLIRRFARLRRLRQNSATLAGAIIGWHIEGPFLSDQPGFHGAHPPRCMRDPHPDDFDQLRQIAGADPLLVTLAPERSGAVDCIRHAVSLGIRISLGHTNATAQQLAGAIAAGATGFTHLGNACPKELDRHDNILWRVLDCEGLAISLIADGIHVSPALFRLIHRAARFGPVFYTTDAMAAAGAPPGNYTVGSLHVSVGKDQIVRQPGKSNFAGSALRPIEGIWRASGMLQRPWQEIWPQLSEIPAKFIGLQRGLVEGSPANFCVLEFNQTQSAVKIETFVRGILAATATHPLPGK